MRLMLIILLFALSSNAQEILRVPAYTAVATTAACPIFETEGQSYIDSAAITDVTQKCAIMTLVKQLKDSSLWTKLSAIYPMLWGDTSHTGVATFNLKNTSTFKAVLNSGNSSTGIYRNATGFNPVEGWLRTGYIPSVDGTTSSYSLAYYSRTNATAADNREMGVIPVGGLEIFCKYTDGNARFQAGTSFVTAAGASSDSRGLFVGSRTSSTSISIYKNGTSLNTNTTIEGTTVPPIEVYVGAVNNAGAALGGSTKLCGFASIGTGLTAAEVLTLYNIVQIFNTTLGRQV